MLKIENEYVSFNELYEAYIDCRKRKRTTSNCINFELDLNKNLWSLYYDLNTMNYEIGKSIVFCVDRPVVREVFAADFRDRIVHHLVINKILPLLENKNNEGSFIENSFSCRKGKGTLFGVNKCYEHIKDASYNYTRDCYVVKCDLKSFFMTINKDELFKKLSNFIKKHYIKPFNTNITSDFIIYLIGKIIYNQPQKNCIVKGKNLWRILPPEKSLFNCDLKHGLPIGNLSSQIFANFYLSEFDHMMTDELKLLYYGRYVDDFYFIVLNKERIPFILDKIKEKLYSMGVILHPKKLYIQHYSKGVNFIGTTLKPNRKYINNRTKGNFCKCLIEQNESLLENNNALNIAHVSGVINSYLGFLKHTKSYKIKRKYISKYCPEILKYCDFSGANKLTSYEKLNRYDYKYIYNYLT